MSNNSWIIYEIYIFTNNLQLMERKMPSCFYFEIVRFSH